MLGNAQAWAVERLGAISFLSPSFPWHTERNGRTESWTVEYSSEVCLIPRISN